MEQSLPSSNLPTPEVSGAKSVRFAERVQSMSFVASSPPVKLRADYLATAHVPAEFVAGSLRRRMKMWRSAFHLKRFFVTKMVMSIALTGLALDPWFAPGVSYDACRSLPIPREYPLTEEQREWVINHLGLGDAPGLLQEGVIEEVDPPKPGHLLPVELDCLSPIFVVDKDLLSFEKRFRLIIDTRGPNSFLVPPKFKLDTLKKVVEGSEIGLWAFTRDLKAGFNHVHLSEKTRRVMGFKIMGRYFRFRQMPFGLCVAPFVFSIMLKPIVKTMRAEGYSVWLYVDDFLVTGRTREEAIAAVTRLEYLLKEFGWQVDPDKGSGALPLQKLEFLGLEIDFQAGVLRVPERKKVALLDTVDKFLEKDRVTLRDIAKVAGKLVSVSVAFPTCRLHSRELFKTIKLALESKHSGRVWDSQAPPISAQAVEDLRWVVQRLRRSDLPEALAFRPSVIAVLTADASGKGSWGKSGWGAWLSLAGEIPPESERAHGGFSADQNDLHIAVKEALALLWGMKSYADQIRGRVLLLRTDNQWAKYDIKREYARNDQLNAVVRQIHEYAMELNCVIFDVEWLSTHDNVIADLASRKTNYWDYSLKSSVFRRVEQRFGPHNLDTMAEQTNAKCATFFTQFPSPGAAAVDAYTRDWSVLPEGGPANVYVFPPFPQIQKVLRHICECQCEATIIVPDWVASWTPLLNRITVDDLPLGPAAKVTVAGSTAPAPAEEKFRPYWNLRAVRVDGSRASPARVG